MTRSTLRRVTAGALVASAAGASAATQMLAGVSGGLWQVTGARPAQLCVADPLALASYEHRSARCTHKVISGHPESAVVSYSCGPAEFGQSTLSVLTPRSLHVETQGISRGAPYNYAFEARRVGECAAH